MRRSTSAIRRWFSRNCANAEPATSRTSVGSSVVTVADRLIERDGRRGLAIHAWTIPAGWDEAHHVEVAVALLRADGSVTTHSERLAFWPFQHETLDEDLRAAGLTPESTTYDAAVERYLVTARRRFAIS